MGARHPQPSRFETFSGAGGEHSHTSEFRFDADHPRCSSARITGPTPVEFLLHALAACLTAGIGNIAAARGVTLTSVESHGRGRHRSAGHPRAVRRRSATATSDPRQVHASRATRRRRSCARSSSSRARARRCSTCSPTACRSTCGRRQPPDGRRRAEPMERREAHRHGHHRRRTGRARHEPLPVRPGIEHVVVERGRVAERWRSERWDSLRLLTPNWRRACPAFGTTGPTPTASCPCRNWSRFLERYATSFGAPVGPDTAVTGRRADRRRIPRRHRPRRVARRDRRGRDRLLRPAVRAAEPHRRSPRRLEQVVPREYRRPGQLPPGGVLVVGASATGIQLAEEIQRSGRQVTLAVGRHTAAAAALPRPRHPLVARCDGGLRRHPRLPAGRPRIAFAAVAAVDRPPGSAVARRRRAAPAGGAPGGPAARRGR